MRGRKWPNTWVLTLFLPPLAQTPPTPYPIPPTTDTDYPTHQLENSTSLKPSSCFVIGCSNLSTAQTPLTYTSHSPADFVYFDGKIIIFMIFRVEQSLGTMITFERLITCRQRAVLRFNIGSFEPTLATKPTDVQCLSSLS